jgi:hypothetical protein
VKVPLRTTPVINEQAPKIPKAGYVTSPSMSDLQNFTINQLQKVKNFSISNDFGLIEFLGYSDLTNVDLKDVVTIERGGLEVYNETRHVPYP